MKKNEIVVSPVHPSEHRAAKKPSENHVDLRLFSTSIIHSFENSSFWIFAFKLT